MGRCVAFGRKQIGVDKFPSNFHMKRKWEKALKLINFKSSDFSRLCGKLLKETDDETTSKTTEVASSLKKGKDKTKRKEDNKRPLNPDLKQKAEVELNETPKILEDGIKHLKEWISKQPHLRARTDDQWLAAFLRGCKHSLERAKEKLDLYYSLRTLSPDLFSFRPNTQRFNYLLQTGAGLLLPKLASPLAPRVVIVKPSLYDPNKISPTDFFSFAHCFQQMRYLEDDAFMVNGSLNIIDLEGITMTHFMQMTPTVLKKLVIAGQDASPLRLKSLHVINTIPAFEKLFNLVTNLLNEKHQKKLHMYSKDLSVLHEYVPPEILPKEYGGQGGTKQEIIDYWLKKLDQYGDWFDEDLKFGTDESKRPGKPKTAESMFGVQGSFRQLDVD